MKKALVDKVFPGAVLLIAQGGRIRHRAAYGVRNTWTGEPVEIATLFDLASLTKPLASSLAAMVLFQRGVLALDEPIDIALPDCAGTDKGNLTPAHLLSHSSGLPDYRPYYREWQGSPGHEAKTWLRKRILDEPLLLAPGERTRYSDLGFILLDWVIEAISGMPLDRFVAENVYGPLGVSGLMFRPGDDSEGLVNVAATEVCPWRKRLVIGRVHDENAYIAGGVQGHAGLFGNVMGVYRVCQVLLEASGGADSRPFSSETVRRFLEPYGNGERSLGFDRPADAGSSSGCHFSPETVGHLGFTGTSFWMDLRQGILIILLSNRVHPTRENDRIRAFRPLLHDSAMAWLKAVVHHR